MAYYGSLKLIINISIKTKKKKVKVNKERETVKRQNETRKITPKKVDNLNKSLKLQIYSNLLFIQICQIALAHYERIKM